MMGAAIKIYDHYSGALFSWIIADIPRDVYFSSSTNSNKSSTVTWNTFAIDIANLREGLYLPFSR